MPTDLLEFEEPVGVLLKEIEALSMMPRTPERERSIERLRQRADEIREGARGNGGGAFYVDFGANPAGDDNFEVGRRKLEAVLVGGEKYIGQDRQRGTGADCTANDIESSG